MKVAIATASYLNLHHTMVNRHILHMFGGSTCVICQSSTDEPRPDRAVFDWSKVQPSYVDNLLFRDELENNKKTFLTDRVPWGRQKRKLKAFLKREQVSFILSEFGPQGIYISPVANELKIPMACYFRGFDASAALQKRRYVAGYREMSNRVEAFFSVSQHLLDNLASHGVKHKESHVIPSGVDIREFKPGKKIKNRCVAVGRMIDKKAPLLTLRAFADVAMDVPDATLEMLGGGPLEDEAIKYVAERGLTDRIWIRGDQSHHEVRNALQRAEIFLQHSVTAKDGNTEGLPTSIQEAMACGTAIVSTRHSGIPEAVEEGVTGFLVDEMDIDEYRNAIRTVLTNSVDLEAIKRNARKTAIERFDNAQLLEKTEAIIERVAKEEKIQFR